MFKKPSAVIVIVCFILTTFGPLPKAHADFNLPVPGTMVNLSPAYEPVMIKGLTVHKDNPFLFDFIVDIGQDRMSGAPLKKEGEKLIKYFLASLTIPDKDVWVNLSPYEHSKIVPEALGQTDMGRDLLAQDYILKQLTASLIYPEKELGKKFWDKVYAKVRQLYANAAEVPINTFNKVWIVADKAEVFEHNQTAFVVGSHLKVMLEEDYLAKSKNQKTNNSSLSSQIVRDIILPEIEKEVNAGKNFANLRQIFNSVILSSWYKKNLKQALLNQIYADQSKIKGIDLNDLTVKQRIYEQYLKAYKRGVFNYIKDTGVSHSELKPRKYFAGGIVKLGISPAMTSNPAMLGPVASNAEAGRLTTMQTLTASQSADASAAMTTKTLTTTKPLNEVVSEIGLHKIVFMSVNGEPVDFSDPAWKIKRQEGEINISYNEVQLTGNLDHDAYAIWRVVTDAIYKNRLNDAIRLYTLNHGLFDKTKQKQIGEDISQALINAYKGKFRLVGKMGGTGILWALATPAGVVTPFYGEPTHIGERGEQESLKAFGEREGNSQADIINRIVSPMVKLATLEGVGYDRIEDYYFSAPGFFDEQMTLAYPEENIANMPKGFRFDEAIPQYLKQKTDGQLNLLGRTVHDGTGHAFGDKSVYGPFSVNDTIYGFWIGTGIASRVSPEGLTSFTGGAEVNNFHNEGPHQAVWNPETGRYEVYFNFTKGNHPDFNTSGSFLFGREDLEDRTSGPGMIKAFIEAYKELKKDPLSREAQEVTRLLNGKELNKATVEEISALKPRLMERIYQERAKELGLGIGALMWYLADHSWENGSRFSLTSIKVPIGGLISKLNSFNLFDQVKAGILQELASSGVLPADREIISNNISMSRLNEGMREFLGGLPPKSFESDKALVVTPGGIDLNTIGGMKWKIAKDGKGVEMDINPTMIARFRRQGIDRLSPTILKITPVRSIWPLVGINRG